MQLLNENLMLQCNSPFERQLRISSDDTKEKRIGVARIFDWGGPNHKLHTMTSSEISKRGTFFMGPRYRRMEDQTPWPDLALKQDFAKGRSAINT